MRVHHSARLAACLCTLVLLAMPAFAQQAQEAADDHAQVQKLLERLAALEHDVQVLQGRSDTPREPAAAPADSPAEAQAGAHDMMTPAGLGMLQIRGFSDVDFRAAQVDHPDTFQIGQLDLFLTSKLAADFSAVGEVVFEALEGNTFEVDVERMLLQYSPSDHLNLGVGRYHTGIGFYNAAYHHGNWFQTTTGRPFIFRFEDEGGILPVHGVGITAQGSIPSGRFGLRYLAEVSNGRASSSPTAEPVQNVEDENHGKAFNVGLISRPDAWPGLQAGFSVYRDRLTPIAQPSVAETIMAAHVVFQSPRFEQLNEIIFIRHAPDSAAQTDTTTSVYSQISRQFGRYRPYLRYEYLDVPETDPVFHGINGRSYGPSFGLKFDVASPIAFKVQYDRLNGPIRNLTNGFTVQLAFTF